ncbi:hypothetical protein LINPERHAP2_LOCUS31875 [Linum perenne]
MDHTRSKGSATQKNGPQMQLKSVYSKHSNLIYFFTAGNPTVSLSILKLERIRR